MEPEPKASPAMETTPAKAYDVCLILEGTYPYVAGGVSSWIHNLVRALPELTFTSIAIFPSPEETAKVKYELPDNFEMGEVVYIHEYEPLAKGKITRKQLTETLAELRRFHTEMRTGDYHRLAEAFATFNDGEPNSAGNPSSATGRPRITTYDLMHSKEAWECLLEQYGPETNPVSFIDYFWTYRFTHLTIFKLLRTPLPRARVYHTISTGFAGLLAATAKTRYRRPMLLTEHGIYTKERKIEIAQAEWIYVAGGERFRVQRDMSTFQKIWVRFFESLGQITYNEADRIYTLYEGNRQLEIEAGADPAKIEVIPNGIDIKRFSELKPAEFDEAERKKTSFKVGFVGRVVPIKDVKTFIRACKIVSLQLPDVKFYIMGPRDEDPDYHRECLDLVELLRLENHVEFTGRINVMEYYPKLDLLVLTSVSEAQPLVILEANCVGIPAVASDVGSCRELVEGRTRQDKQIGPSGMITRVADPESTARGIVAILGNPKLRERMFHSGRERVRTFYRESDLNRKYLSIYQHYGNQE